MTARDLFEYGSYQVVARLLRALPLRWAQRIGLGIAWLALRVGTRYQHPTLQNLRLVFPDRSEDERFRIACESFVHFAWNVIDFVRAEAWDAEETLRRVDLVGLENLEKALEKGRGVLILSLHLGNFELAVRRVALAGAPVVAVGRPMRNALIYERLREQRTRFGAALVDRDNAARQMLRALRSNKAVAVLNDQYAHRTQGIFVPFFGLRALTSPGIATLSLRTGAPVIPGYIVRDGHDHHTVYLDPPLERIETGDRAADIEASTTAQNEVLEGIIRRHPEQWMWANRRFRKSPDLAGPPYDPRRGRKPPYQPPPSTTLERAARDEAQASGPPR